MPQQGDGNSGWSVDSWDQEAIAFKQRLAELTKDGRMSQGEAVYLTRREDNDQVVKMNIEKAEKERTQETPAQEQVQPSEPTQPRTLSFFEDQDRPARNYNELKQEHAEAITSKEQGEGPTLSFSEDEDQPPRKDDELKQDQANGRTLNFAEDRSSGPDLGR